MTATQDIDISATHADLVARSVLEGTVLVGLTEPDVFKKGFRKDVEYEKMWDHQPNSSPGLTINRTDLCRPTMRTKSVQNNTSWSTLRGGDVAERAAC